MKTLINYDVMSRILRFSALAGLVLTQAACRPNEYAFEKRPFDPQLDCPSVVCALPYEKGCRWEKPAFDRNQCLTACGVPVCDAPIHPELESLEQVGDTTELHWKEITSPGSLSFRVNRRIAQKPAGSSVPSGGCWGR